MKFLVLLLSLLMLHTKLSVTEDAIFMIKLHPQLEKGNIRLGNFNLCTLVLINDANYPWFILVPMRENITEIYQLSEPDQTQLLAESMYFSRCLQQVFQADKLNIAALGNVVPQLHIHHIARFKNDTCWPAPVWGAAAAIEYTETRINVIKQRLSIFFTEQTEQIFNWA
jgi:diadenosine tetraphosphate (Ap4A) HIT family hydrolase